MQLERRLLTALCRDPELLDARHEAQLRWALTLARTSVLRAPSGRDVVLSEELTPFREWLTAGLAEALPSSTKVDGARLRTLIPTATLRLVSARRKVLENHVDDFGAEHLDEEIRHKKLVLVLGGGGGSGFAHLGIFQLADELGHVPELIVGSSMGSLMGLFRSVERSYSSAAITQTVPSTFDLGRVFRPFNGVTRFGMPGAFHMQLLRVAAQALDDFVGRTRLPLFSELPIRLEVVATGVRTGFHYSPALEREINNADATFSPFALRRRIKIFSGVVRELTANPRLLRLIVFGRHDGTRHLNAVEGVGFSCAVPGLFCYDVFHDDPQTVGILERLFRKHRLWRATDGGVISNVPARVAWESVMQGNIGTRNTFIFAADVFAPTSSPSALWWNPIQQFTRPVVAANRPFCDYLKTFRRPPSPLNLSPSRNKLVKIVQRAYKELEPDAAIMRKALTPLPVLDAITP